MIEPHSAKRTLSDHIEAVIRKDTGVVDRFFHPDVGYVVNGAPDAKPDSWIPPISFDCLASLSWLGLYRGRMGVKGFLDRMHKNLDVTAFGPTKS